MNRTPLVVRLYLIVAVLAMFVTFVGVLADVPDTVPLFVICKAFTGLNIVVVVLGLLFTVLLNIWAM